MANTIIEEIKQQTTSDTHLVRDVSSVLSMLDPDLYALDTMLRRMPKGEAASNTKIEWATVDSWQRRDLLNGTTTAGSQYATKTITVDTGGMWRKHDLIYTPDVPSNPILRIESISGNDLTVRALGIKSSTNTTGRGTVPAMNDNTVLAWIGNAKEEGFTYSTSRAVMPSYDYNFEELFDTVVTVSKTRTKTKNYTVNDWLRARREQLKEFRRSIEYKLWFGDRTESLSENSELVWTMAGITRFITKTMTYDRTIVGAPRITETQLIDWLIEIFTGNNGSSTRFLFADSYLAGELMKVPLANLRSRELTQVLGVKVDKIEFNFGTLYIKHHRGFNEIGKNHYGVVVDLESVYKRDLRPMERIVLELEKIGTDKEAEQYKEQSSIEVRNAPAHAIIQGIAA